MNKLFVFTAFLFFIVSCSDEKQTFPAEIVLTVSGECVAEISIYNTTGKRLAKETYDCQETKALVFHIDHSGPLIIHAETKTKEQKKVINVAHGKTTEVNISF
ncbi:MAG: hypothetical protein LBK58_10275 [Prevotellaceae bacterium]|jgi:hypothetical protein|nr:hypothetical protein [Prevotellaceae bacterium]